MAKISKRKASAGRGASAGRSKRLTPAIVPCGRPKPGAISLQCVTYQAWVNQLDSAKAQLSATIQALDGIRSAIVSQARSVGCTNFGTITATTRGINDRP